MVLHSIVSPLVWCCLKLNSEAFLLSGDAEKERANQRAAKDTAESRSQWNQGKLLKFKSLDNGAKKNDRMKIESKLMNSLAYFFFQVDISTMLEEAVQYVKFLQLQIKVGPRKILARIILLVRAAETCV